MTELTDLLTAIDLLVTDIQSDTTRAKLGQLGELLKELAVKYGEAERDTVRAKNKYERELVMKKEQREQELSRLADNKYKKDLELSPKARKDRVTNADIERLAELDLIGLKDEITEPLATSVYLKPILKQYNELVNDRKFLARE